MPDPTVTLPLPGATVAHHQPLAVLAALVGEALDVVGSLGLQRGRDHPTRALARELVERDRDLIVASPTGSLRTSSMACLPSPPHGGRS